MQYENLYSALTHEFEKRGLTHDDGTPIKAVGEPITDQEFERRNKERIEQKIRGFLNRVEIKK